MAKIDESVRTPAPPPRPSIKPADLAKKVITQKAVTIPKPVVKKAQLVSKRTGKR